MADDFTFTDDTTGETLETSDIPGWSASKDWNTVTLGGVKLPGICEIVGFKTSVKIDKKKAKSLDLPATADIGLELAEFKISVWLKDEDWGDWVSALPVWNPRRPGRERSPLVIIHPLPNSYGVREVRVTDVNHPAGPTAGGGMKIEISILEWSDSPKATKPATKNAASDKAVDPPAFDFVHEAARGEHQGTAPGFTPPEPPPPEDLTGPQLGFGLGA